jgi:hypothetical protein
MVYLKNLTPYVVGFEFALQNLEQVCKLYANEKICKRSNKKKKNHD